MMTNQGARIVSTIIKKEIMKKYIYYDKNTKIYKSTEFREKNDKYPNCDFIKMDFEDWKSFLDTYPEIIKIEAGELKSEKRKRDIEEIRDMALSPRKAYLRETALEWCDDLENMPQEMKEKRARVRAEKKEIKSKTNKKDLESYKNF